MNEGNGQAPMTPTMKEGGGTQGMWIAAVIVVVVIAVGFFIFSDKNSDVAKEMPVPTENKPVNDVIVTKESGDTGKDVVTQKTYTVTYNGDVFVPANLTIQAGEKVTFINESDIDMWVASAVHPTHEMLPEFDQGFGTTKGTTYSFTFTKTGTWKFHDHLNPSARGGITVQ